MEPSQSKNYEKIISQMEVRNVREYSRVTRKKRVC